MAKRETMNISVSSEHKLLVKGLVASGRYRNDSEVVRDALRLLDDRERSRRLEEALLEGLDSGEPVTLDAQGLENMRREMARHARAARQPRSKSA